MKIQNALAALAVFFAAVSPVFAGKLADVTKGKLVRLSGAEMVAADDALAGKEIVAIYYSAHWCGPCRKFTPKLVEFYNNNKEKYPKFELIFASSDNSAKDMQGYMAEAKMPWPALKYGKGKLEEIAKHSARGIPYLVVLDADGNELIAKAAGQDWRPPTTVLPELKKLLEAKQ